MLAARMRNSNLEIRIAGSPSRPQNMTSLKSFVDKSASALFSVPFYVFFQENIKTW